MEKNGEGKKKKKRKEKTAGRFCHTHLAGTMGFPLLAWSNPSLLWASLVERANDRRHGANIPSSSLFKQHRATSSPGGVAAEAHCRWSEEEPVLYPSGFFTAGN